MCGENKCELCKAGKVGIGVARLARARLNAQPGAVWSRARSERVGGWRTDETGEGSDDASFHSSMEVVRPNLELYGVSIGDGCIHGCSRYSRYSCKRTARGGLIREQVS